MHVGSLCALVLAACGTAAAGAAPTVVTLRRPASAVEAALAAGPEAPSRQDLYHSPGKSDVTVLDTSFESGWPEPPWRATHPADAARVDWGRNPHRASGGTRSIWCARTGADAPPLGGPVPPNTEAWAIAGPFDLSAATAARLTFDLWLETEEYQDLFMWLASTNGETFHGYARSTDTDGWATISYDLTDWADLGNLIGSTHLWIAFVYKSDDDIQREGAYVDEVTLVADSGGLAGEEFTYTTTEDFELGTLVGLDASSDALQLSSSWSAFPYIWVPSPSTGTVSRLDTQTGRELARLVTGPALELDPSPVAVDLDGACWVGNRGAGTVVKLGLPENGGCTDRDGDGTVDTSTDANGDGDIATDEVLVWGEDECALLEVSLVSGMVGGHTPGEEHTAYARNNLSALAIDAENDVWAGVYDDGLLYHLDGDTGEILETVDLASSSTHPFAVAVDRAGDLWVTSWPDAWVLHVGLSDGSQTQVALTHGSRGLAVDPDGRLWVTDYSLGALSSVDTATGVVGSTYSAGWAANGVAVTADGNIWVATGAAVNRFNAFGPIFTLDTFIQPSGVAVDSAGNVWVVGTGSSTVLRVNSTFNQVDLQKDILSSGGHETAGDLAGSVARNVTTRYGTWSVVRDSGLANTSWGTITWQGTEPDGTRLTVRARSSHDQETWSGWETAVSGVALSTIPAGRYLEVEVAMQTLSGTATPALEELTVAPLVETGPPVADFVWSPLQPQTGERVLFTDRSTRHPTSWSWDFGDGETSTLQSPDHVFSEECTFNVTLAAANDEGTDSESKDVAVGGGGSCTLVCTATAPASGAAGEPMLFSASVTSSCCQGAVVYSWSFGDGATSSELSPSHAYAGGGTFTWDMTASLAGATCTSSGQVEISHPEPRRPGGRPTPT